MDFLGIAGQLWDLLIITLLPIISILMAFIMIYKILDAMQTTVPKFVAKHLPRARSKR